MENILTVLQSFSLKYVNILACKHSKDMAIWLGPNRMPGPCSALNNHAEEFTFKCLMIYLYPCKEGSLNSEKVGGLLLAELMLFQQNAHSLLK